jgi:hypothetical protein
MQWLRASIRDHRHLALIVLGLAFVVRATLPAGYMVSRDVSSTITISVCSDASGVHKVTQLVIPARQGEPGKSAGQAAKDGPCAFSAMAKSVLGGTDPILLALAFAFILILGLAPSRVLPARPVPHTLPPLRGPPSLG